MSHNVFSVQGLITWLETQPPETEYRWTDTVGCLGLRYMKERGVQDIHKGYGAFGNIDLRYNIFALRPWTIGAALDRARAVVEG